jgi:transposase
VGGNQVSDLGQLGAEASQGNGPSFAAEGQAEEEESRALAGSGGDEPYASPGIGEIENGWDPRARTGRSMDRNQRGEAGEPGGATLAGVETGMLSFTGSLKIYVAVEPCDMRKGYEGLAALVTTALQQDLRGGALFAFSNRRRTRLKVLYFDGTGLWLMTKRLEEGTFSWPQGGEKVLALRPEAFAMLTDGVDLRGGKMRPWYERGEREITSEKVLV